jgi:hypothetical protein
LKFHFMFWSPKKMVFKYLSQGSNMKASILWALKRFEQSIKSQKGLRTIVIWFHMLTTSLILVCISMSLATLTYASNFNLSLESCTYNLIVEVKKSNSSQYKWCWLITHMVSKRKKHHKLCQQWPNLCWRSHVK